jgi:flagellar hook assembly protein FlgD
VNLDVQPHAAYSSLWVVVKRAEPGPVTVRVLNLEGEAAVLLYEGNLEPGSWVFDWDGMLPGGQKAPAGYYQIQVLSGPVTQKKIIQIQ